MGQEGLGVDGFCEARYASREGEQLSLYNQSPLTAIPATKKDPMRIICSTATKLSANQRKPFIL